MPFAKYSVTDIFPSCNGERYVLDGTNCNSFGILNIKIESLEFEVAGGGGPRRRPRLKLKDGRKNYFNLSWTSEESLEEKYQELAQKKSGTDILVILGLGRPWNGEFNFQIKRCYILAIGIVH